MAFPHLRWLARRWAPFCAMLSVLGCGRANSSAPPSGGTPAADPQTHGSRLLANLLVSADGPSLAIPGSFYDSELETECRFYPTDDGAFRCVPSVNGGDSAYLASPMLFADAACTAPAVQDYKSNYMGLVSSSCPRQVSVYERGPALDTVWFGSDCAPHQVSDAVPNDAYVAYGVHIPSNRFVQAVTVPLATNSELGLLQLSAEDGASQLLGFYDVARGRPCDKISNLDGLRCVSDAAGIFSPGTGDPTCDAHITLAPPCSTPAYVVQPIDHEHSAIYGVETRAPLEPAVAACAEAAQASLAGQTPPRVLTVIGPELDPSEFPQLQLLTQQVGRLRQDVLADASGNVRLALQTMLLFDTQLQVACSVPPAADDDGNLPCLPVDVASAQGYADAECTVPLFPTTTPSTPLSGSISGNPPGSPARFGKDSKPGGARVFRLLGPHSGPVYRRLNGQAPCEVTTVDVTLVDAEELPPDAFVRYQRVHR